MGEMGKGITPGPLIMPAFHTDFGIIGIQICHDIQWSEGWTQLREKGVEIVFWPSAFAGGKELICAPGLINIVSSQVHGRIPAKSAI